jgi:hypothetical protein
MSVAGVYNSTSINVVPWDDGNGEMEGGPCNSAYVGGKSKSREMKSKGLKCNIYLSQENNE